MESLRTPLSAQEQLDMDLVAEMELSRLKRQYRLMENERKTMYEELNITLIRQRRILTTLQKERDNLLLDIRTAKSANRRRRDAKISQKLRILLENYQKIVNANHKAKLRLNEIEYQIKKTSHNLVRMQSKRTNETNFRQKLGDQKKLQKILENRLETSKQKYGIFVQQNRESREKIDHLLKERENYNLTWEKLKDDLNASKKQLIELIDHATMIFDQREDWCSKLKALKIRTHNDVITHMQEMRELQRQLDHDGQLKEFLGVKSQKRVMKDLEEKELKKIENEKLEIEKKSKLYKGTLEKIKTCCVETKTEKIAKKYVKRDEENFALFNYVNELNNQLDCLTQSISEIKQQIEEKKSIHEQHDETQKATFTNMKFLLDETRGQADEDLENLKKSEEIFDSVLAGIIELFEMLHCEGTPILDLLDRRGSTINTDNVLVYLGLIEKKIAALITSVYFKERSMNNGGTIGEGSDEMDKK